MGLTVLLVDDERMPREILRDHIPWQELGVERVLDAEDGYEALELAKKYLPQIIISDIKMPRMDGLELAEAIRQSQPDCRFVFLSGYADKQNLKEAIKLKASRFVEKPLDLAEITEVLRELVQECLSLARDPVQDFLRDRADGPISKLEAYLVEHCAEPDLSIKRIADDLNFTHTYLCTMYKKHTGETINRRITTLRIERACELLHSTAMPLYKVGQKVGYSDGQYFFRVFQKEKGMTPREYRDMINEK